MTTRSTAPPLRRGPSFFPVLLILVAITSLGLSLFANAITTLTLAGMVGGALLIIATARNASFAHLRRRAGDNGNPGAAQGFARSSVVIRNSMNIARALLIPRPGWRSGGPISAIGFGTLRGSFAGAG